MKPGDIVTIKHGYGEGLRGTVIDVSDETVTMLVSHDVLRHERITKHISDLEEPNAVPIRNRRSQRNSR